MSSEQVFESPLAAALGRRVIGQQRAIGTIVPYVHMYEAGLSPEGRPAGVFLLLGPTGTGKTRTVEALAAELHGDERSLLRIDCGEFQMEHEVAKLIGAPPGYLGHRETHPMISQQKLDAATSERSKLALVLFDEIEKAAPSLTRLLLGVLDRATLHLGDNTVVDFTDSLVFLTSNLGAREILGRIRPRFGLHPRGAGSDPKLHAKLERAAMSAVRRHFSPEFVNRIDAVITYEPLSAETLRSILDQQLRELQLHIRKRLGGRAFTVTVTEAARNFLLEQGTSAEFGARELKRTIHRCLVQPLAALHVSGEIRPGGAVLADWDGVSHRLSIAPQTRRPKLQHLSVPAKAGEDGSRLFGVPA